MLGLESPCPTLEKQLRQSCLFCFVQLQRNNISYLSSAHRSVPKQTNKRNIQKYLECGTCLEVSVTETGGMWKRWARCIWWEVEKDGNADRNTQWNMKGGLWSDFFVSDGEADTVMSKTIIDSKHWERRVSLPCLYANLHTLFISSSHITAAVNLSLDVSAVLQPGNEIKHLLITAQGWLKEDSIPYGSVYETTMNESICGLQLIVRTLGGGSCWS